MKTSIASPDWGYGFGRVLRVEGEAFTPDSVPEATAEAWIESEQAEVVERDPDDVDDLRAENDELRKRIQELEQGRAPQRETATRPPPETATQPAPKPSKAAPKKAADTEAAPKAERPADDREALPPGYSISHAGGGYYELTGPAGVIEGLSNGKHQGKDGAADAAWADYQAETG